MNSWIQLCSCPKERLLLTVRHAHAASPACWIEVMLGRIDGVSGDRVVHQGRLMHDAHLGWVVRWLDDQTFAVRGLGGEEACYRLDGNDSARLLTDARSPSRPAPLPVARSSEPWLDYFRRDKLPDLPWEDGPRISPVERAVIESSIQAFQLGTSSDGAHLTTCATRTGDAEFKEAVRHLIRRQQRHARDLARFMALADIPTVTLRWSDTIFRILRRFAGLEVSLGVLITAEIVAQVYFPALREATRSPLLKRLCDGIIQEENQHVEFLAERLAILRCRRGIAALATTHGLQRFLFLGTCLVVWRSHRDALKAGGYDFGRFWRWAWRRFGSAMRRMDPRTYGNDHGT